MRTIPSVPGRIAALFLAIVSGCSSQPVNLAPLPPAHYRVLGRAIGHACGALGILTPPLYVVPLGLNERVEKAYRAALQSVPGATGLIRVELQDDWYWWVLASSHCMTVTGDAIQEARR